MDHYNIKRAHIFGIGFGGLIAQIVSCMHPNRCRSATFMMSTFNFTEASEKPYAQEENFKIRMNELKTKIITSDMTL